MRRLGLILALFASHAFAQISMEEKQSPHRPIVVGCKCTIPEGATARFTWSGSKGLHLIPVGDQVHIWGDIGDHKLTSTVVIAKQREIELANGEKLTVIVGFEVQTFSKLFSIVGKQPAPGPKPTPVDPDDPPTPNPSSDFDGIIAAGLGKVGQSGQAAKRKVATIYRAVANDAKTDSMIDVGKMMDLVKTRVFTELDQAERAAWRDFWPELGRAFASLKLQRSDKGAHVAAFVRFSDLLLK